MPRVRKKLASLLRFSRVTRVLLGLFFALVISIIFVGLDNVTGIMLGLAAATVLLTALTCRWRKIRNFVILFIVSIVGVFFLAFLHEEVVYPLVALIGGADALQSLALHIFSEVVSILMLFIAPVGIFIGLSGTIILSIVRLINLINKKFAINGT